MGRAGAFGESRGGEGRGERLAEPHQREVDGAAAAFTAPAS